MQLVSRWTRVAAALAVVTLAACGDRTAGLTDPDASRPATAAATVPGIVIGIDSNPLTIARGTSATVNVRVARVAGFTGPVTLGVDTTGMTAGVRATIANGTVAAGDTAARVVTITVDTSAAVTTTPAMLRITASGAGVTMQTLLVMVNVVDQLPGFTVGFAGTTPGATVLVGQSGTVRLVVTRVGGFTGPVAFTADSLGLPAGVTVTQGATVGDTITLDLAATGATMPGTYNVTLRGAGDGVAGRTLTLPLVIQPTGAFSLGVTPNFTAAGPGATVVVPVSIARTGGFGGRVAFAATTLPPGFTATFDTAATAGTLDSIVTVRITAPASAAAGTYAVTLRGTSPGLTDQTATFNVIVPAPGFSIGEPSGPLTILAGAANSVQLPIVRSAGFGDSVVFTVSGAPAGLTVQTTTIRPGADNTSATVNLTAEGNVAAGTYPITITATAPNGVRQVVTTAVTVVTGNPSGFQLQVSPTTLTVPAGGSATTVVDVVRLASFANYVFVGAQDVPAGLTVTFSGLSASNTTTGGAVSVNVAAAATVAPGRYAFRIVGASPLAATPSATIVVNVTGPTPAAP